MNKIDKPVARLTENKEKRLINLNQKWKWRHTTELEEIKRIAKEFYELHIKLVNLNEMDRFLEMYKLFKLTQEEKEKSQQSYITKKKPRIRERHWWPHF